MYYNYPWGGILECVNNEVAFEIEYEVEKTGIKSKVISEKIVEKDIKPAVQKATSEKGTNKKVTPQVVMEVYQNKYGKGATDGTERFTKLSKAGYNPINVQDKVNWVYKIASGFLVGEPSVINKYGNGKKRRETLGDWYDVVQKEINVLAGIDRW